MRRTFNHKGVSFVIWPSEEEGYWHYQFTIDAKTARGTRQAKLIGLAVRRIQIQIDAELRQRAKR
jgi:hypothetical protein